MRLPRRIKAGGHWYRVRLATQAELIDKDGEELEGLSDNSALTILILRSLPMSKKQEILYHEVMHAALYPSTLDESEPGHEIVYLLGVRMPMVLRDNPQMVAYMLRGSETKSEKKKQDTGTKKEADELRNLSGKPAS